MKIIKINRKKDWANASPNDLVELFAPKGNHPLFYMKRILHYLVLSIIRGGCIHISGSSGSGKTSLISSIATVPENWRYLCQLNNVPVKPLEVFHLAAYNYDSPNEVWHRRAINEHGTYDETQALILFLQHAIKHQGEAYFAVNIMEIGRMKPQLMNALVHLITKGEIINPLNGESIGAGSIAYIADSNYAAADQYDFLLADKDTALFNRINATGLVINHLSSDQELSILKRIKPEIGCAELSDDLLEKITYLGSRIREEQIENGALSSVSPVSMRQYFSFMETAALSPMPPEDIVDVTLFAHASKEDQSTIDELKSHVFGIERSQYAADDFDIPY